MRNSFAGDMCVRLVKVIGKEDCQLADDHYNSDNYNIIAEEDQSEEYTLLDQLVRKIQLPIALLAYLKFIPSGDLTHSDKGRQIFVSDTEKPAFEWQVERDNQNILSLAYEAIDLLLEFLDLQLIPEVNNSAPEMAVSRNLPVPSGTNAIAEVWGISDAYVKMKSTLISLDEFNDIFPVNGSRRLFICLFPFITKVQKQFIIPIITEGKYNELKEGLSDVDLTADQKKLISMIHPVIVYFNMSLALKGLPVEVLPEGIFQNYIGNVISAKNTANRMDRIEVSFRLEKLAKDEMKRLQEYIRKVSTEMAGGIYCQTHPLDRVKEEDKYVRF